MPLTKEQKHEIESDLEQTHLETAKRRRDEIRSGKVQPVDGDEALARVRRLVESPAPNATEIAAEKATKLADIDWIEKDLSSDLIKEKVKSYRQSKNK